MPRTGGVSLPVREPSRDVAERVAARWRRLGVAHRRLVAGVRAVLCVATCVGLLVLAIAFVLVPSTRNGVAVFLGTMWLLVQVALLTPSRTLSLLWLARLCALGAVLAAPIGLVEVALGRLVGWEPVEPQAEAFVAGPVEEVLKLLPVALVGAVAWHRMRRFSAADFLVAGAAAGAGFQLTEDLIRRIASSAGFLGSLYMGAPNLTKYGPVTLFPGWGQYDTVEFAGHGVTTAMVTAGIGLAVMLRRWRGWRWLLPVLLLCWVIFDHMGFNSTAGLGGHLMPDVVAGVHTALGAGNANRYLLLVLLVIAVAIDCKAINSVERHVPPLMPVPVGQSSTSVATASPTPIRPPVSGLAKAGPGAELARQVNVCWRASRAGLGAYVLALDTLRRRRELAVGVYRARGQPRRHSALTQGVHEQSLRLAALLAVTALLSVVWWPRATARQGTPVFLAGLFDDLATWWNNLSPTAQALVIAGAVAALLLLGAGFVGTAAWARFGISIATRMMLRQGVQRRAGYATARYLSSFLSRSMRFTTHSIQHGYKHAAHFGVTGNWNKAAGEIFEKALEAHIRDRGTIVVEGSFRGERVTHFFNPRTSLNVMRRLDGELLGGWRLRPDPIHHLLRTGRLGGGR